MPDSQDDVEANECNLGIDGRNVVSDALSGSIEVGLVESDGDTDDSDNEFADEHTKSAIDEERATTDALHGPEGEGCGAYVDQIEDE